MQLTLALSLLASTSPLVTLHAQSAPRGTPAEARSMLEKAVTHYQQMGRAKALADFTSKRTPFVDRDLYVFCFSPDLTVSAHGADASQVGVKIDNLKDADGFAFGTAMFEAGQQPDGGSVEYKWLNPVTKQVEPKISFVRKVGEDVCGVGAYQ